MEPLRRGVEVFVHPDTHLTATAGACGPYAYLLLFVIIFAVPGGEVTPFLPGDSLLLAGFAIGNLPLVRDHYGLVIVTIVLTSVVPMAAGLPRCAHPSPARTHP